ncbi:tellurite resistance TerB family protein [Sulfitobacter guttiformis]|uniref:Putative tellurite resistance protein B-like protein n=1 Tax=Sulfitobacter guttiformis TaxID=74349 RepID=A0A420DJQ2_9RHOB|nr:TerB family tellurite resistance protein [Sulfitobacter guttiformis]KIN71706.1 TerB domain containing protein [Sulfitobacter guttiformis KCTC 32187]RKE94470.1 putative tellurite resistance protein B-like protein [Sulfitobacter guttiformis]
MFADFLKRLTDPAPAQLPDSDARLALTALLVRVARSDNHYSEAERARIQNIISKRYDLDTGARDALLADAEALEAEAPDTVRFTRAIKDAVPYDDRLAVVEALWNVVLADGSRAKEEDALLRLVANLLGITDMDSAQARQRAEQ